MLSVLDLSINNGISGDIGFLDDTNIIFPELEYLKLNDTRITGSINSSIKDIFPNIEYLRPSGLIFDSPIERDYCLAPSSTPSSTPSPQ